MKHASVHFLYVSLLFQFVICHNFLMLRSAVQGLYSDRELKLLLFGVLLYVFTMLVLTFPYLQHGTVKSVKRSVIPNLSEQI